MNQPVTPWAGGDRLARLIVESSTDFAIITTDPAGVITSWNVGAERLMRWTAEEAVGRHGRMIFTPEDREAGSPEDEMRRALADGRAVDERPHMRADGTRFWGSGLLMPLLDDPAGESQGFLKIVRDRTGEHEAQRRFTTLTDALPGFVFVTDTDGHNVQVNGSYQQYTGKSVDELLGDRWLEVLHPRDRDRAAEVWGRAVETGEVYEANYLFRRHDGVYRCFSCRGVPERDDEGRVLRWLGTCIDAETQAQARSALEALNRNLEQAVTERTSDLQAALDSLQGEITERERAEEALRQSQKMEAIGQLTGGVAHDFNNLLTIIRSSVDLLRRPDLSEDRRRRYVDAIGDTVDRAAKLTGQLLAFARRSPLTPEVFDAGERLRALTGLLITTLGSRATLDLRIECEPCPVEADPNQFDTAILNMAVNARDAMNGEGALTVRVFETDGVPAVRLHPPSPGAHVAISVADTGPGIPPDVLERVFEPFYTTKEVGKGTGLGLSQVHGFAKQSGGEIDAYSPADGGATFTLYLPRASAAVPAVAEPAERPAAERSSGDRGCVLVVEDNQLVGEFAAQLLQELGYDTVWAATAHAGLEAIGDRPERFDLVLTDVIMPGMSGLELARELKTRAPQLPVVLTSGYSHVLADDGAHGFPLLQKPYTVERLSGALRKAMTEG